MEDTVQKVNSFLLVKGGPLILITILLKKLGGEVTITMEDVVLEIPSGPNELTFSVLGGQPDA